MSKRAGLLVLLSAMTAAVGCNRIDVGFFGDDAFYAAREHYRLHYLQNGAGTSRVLTGAWRLENFVIRDGQPTVASQDRRFWTNGNVSTPDGTSVRARVELFDLRLVHGRDGSVIFVRTLPVPETAEYQDLRVLARDYVDRTSGGAYYAVTMFGSPAVREQRFAPRIATEGPARVNGEPAYRITFELVDLDRRRSEPDARGEVISLVFLKPGRHRWRSGVQSGLELPMVMLFGYATRAEHHADHLDDFTSLMSRFEVRP